MDINVRELRRNAFRVTKERGITSSRIRVPGGFLKAEYLGLIQEVADKYGDGTVHITTRQGFEILGIDMKDIPKVNAMLQPIIEGLEINQEVPGKGYSAAGTRNVSACIGNKACPFANYNTTNFAKKIEKAVFPNNLHFKIALTGCANDCIKSRMHDFGIIGMTEPQFDKDRCVSCGACIKACSKKSTGALRGENYRPVRNHDKCIGCGQCVISCPTGAWSRSKEKYYRLAIMGRTGKKNPRLAEDFIIWVDEESIIKIIQNTYKYVEEYISKDAPEGKEHIGYIIDRTGFMEYKKWALEGVELSDKAILKENIYWSGIKY
ncbi:sulfite reductase subunit C [Clostridium isatidis]|uniref:sulfite reductase subunit C n=1 Tax=Clostridium isatidis TaxID=182773 RepID=UPI00169D7978|nr:sulfite reductase subunit C [Clostridiales bacterium]